MKKYLLTLALLLSTPSHALTLAEMEACEDPTDPTVIQKGERFGKQVEALSKEHRSIVEKAFLENVILPAQSCDEAVTRLLVLIDRFDIEYEKFQERLEAIEQEKIKVNEWFEGLLLKPLNAGD